MTRQGLPAANTPSGMSRVTTLPAPITERDLLWLGDVVVRVREVEVVRLAWLLVRWGRTRPTGAAHSRLHAEAGQHPRLQDEPGGK